MRFVNGDVMFLFQKSVQKLIAQFAPVAVFFVRHDRVA